MSLKSFLSSTLCTCAVLFLGWNLYTSSHTIMVSGVSMNPTYEDGQIIDIDSDVSQIERDDVIIIRRDDENFIKRVIAKPGDTLNIKNDQIFINDVYVEDMGGINAQVTDPWDYPITLHAGQYFVMGDNRKNSWDSRSQSFGLVNQNEIFAVVKETAVDSQTTDEAVQTEALVENIDYSSVYDN